jgi:hypothetical protein
MVRSEGDTSLKNPVTPPGIDRGTVRLNHYATPGPSPVKGLIKTLKCAYRCYLQHLYNGVHEKSQRKNETATFPSIAKIMMYGFQTALGYDTWVLKKKTVRAPHDNANIN